MKMNESSEVEEAHIDLTPMIDTVMFLLIFFMLTTTLRQKENDLGIMLPGATEAAGPVDIPDEQIIEVDSKGNVSLNGKNFVGTQMPELVKTLYLYRKAAEASKIKSLITVQAEDATLYERVIDVMNACAAAGIKDITFGAGGGGD